MSDPISDRDDAIAVIGMAVRVPGATDLEEFWENLANGRESVVELDEQTLRANGVRPERLADENYVRVAAPVAGIEDFDADFFGLTPRDAAATDPQIKLFLEVAHAAIENAGYDPTTTEQSIGVMASVGASRYGSLHLGEDAELAGGVGLGLHTLNNSDYLATTTSYRLNLRGPSVTVLTACSSSLVALHLACQSLRAGDCDVVIVGGADVEFPVGHGYLWTPGSILSRDGHCRPFDAAANGTVFGSGAAAVLLKPLAEARRDGDRISAVVLASAVNNDGADKVSFGAPSLTGQAAVIMEAMQLAGVAPAEIGYVEMHGTGTPLGDPIEVSALTEAYAALSDEPAVPGSCGIGSVKGNVGHLGPVAGIIGLVKTVLALDREQLPPTINLETVNPRLELAAGPFEPVRQLRAWPPGRPRLAGVSSLGIGGSNAHVVLAGPPEPEQPFVPAGPQLLVWSARDPVACRQVAQRLSNWFVQHGELAFADGAATTQHGRTAHAVRRAVVATDARDAAAAILDEARVIRPADADPISVPGLAEVPDAAFRALAGRVPAYAGEVAELLRLVDADGRAAEEWAAGRPFGRPLAVAARIALVRCWLGLGLESTLLQPPSDIADLLVALDNPRAVLAGSDSTPDNDAGTASGTGSAAQTPDRGVAPADPGSDPLWQLHLRVLGRIWAAGNDLDWTAAGCPPPRRRAALPGYPYQRVRHWVPFRGTPAIASGTPAEPTGTSPGTAPAASWYPVWRQVDAGPVASRADSVPAGTAVLCSAPGDTGRAVQPALRQLGYQVERPGTAATDATPALVVDARCFGEQDGEPPSMADVPASTGTVRLLLTSRAADVSGCDPVVPAHAELARQALAGGLADRWLDAPPDTSPDRLAAAVSALLAGAPGAALALRGSRQWCPAASALPQVAEDGNPVRALDRRAGTVLVVDEHGSIALEFAQAIAEAGVAAALRVVTAAGPANAAALLEVEDYGPGVELIEWDGSPDQASSAVARAAANARLAALVVVSQAADTGLVPAVVAGLAAAVPAISAAVQPATGLTVPAAAAASAAAPQLPGERRLTLLADPAAAPGRLLLRLLTSPAPELVVGAG